MASLVIPPSPNWYETSILACSPDNTLIYGTRNDIVILEKCKHSDIPAKVKIIQRAHTQKVIAVGINRNWNNPNKYIVSAGHDKIVNVWDSDTRKKKISHNAHINHEKVIGVAFAGDDRILSVSEDGNVVVFHMLLNETNVLTGLFGFKVTITCMSVCPHVTWLAAFGLRNGLVMVVDLRKTGRILHKLRGHDKSVLSLAWCPASVNIFPKNPGNCVGIKKDNENIDNGAKTSSVVHSNVEEGRVIESETSSSEKKSNYTTNEYCRNTNDEAIEIQKEPNLLVNTNIIKTTSDISENEFESSKSTGNIHENKSLEKSNLDISNLRTDYIPTEFEVSKSNGSGIDQSKPVQDNSVEVSDQSVTCNSADINRKKTVEESNPEVSDQLTPEAIQKELDDSKSDVAIIDQNKPLQENNLSTTDVTQGEFQDSKYNGTDSIQIKPVQESNVEVSDQSTTDVIKNEFKQSLSEGNGNNSLEKSNIEISDRSTTDIIKNVIENSKSNDSGIDKDKSVEESNLEVSDQSTTYKHEQTCENAGRRIIANSSIEEDPRREFLLASSAKENKIYIWRAGTDGRLQTFLTFPKASSRKNYNSDKNWITLHWATPTKLLSSSKTAELVQWTLPKSKGNSNSQVLIHNEHQTQLFSIAGPVILLNEYNWHDEPDVDVWTTGQDRLLLNTSLSSKRNILSAYPTFGGSVCCVQRSPLDPNRLAMGTTDGFIKLLDLSKSNVNVINMINFYQKIQSRVMSLAWHPTNEVYLAYGTYEGRVGYLDISNISKSPVLFAQYFKTQIHKVEYGPLNGNTDELAVYAISEGNIAKYNAKNPKEDPIILEKPDDSYIYTFSWKPDFSMLVVSTKKNTLVKYSPDLKISEIKYVEHKIQNICWHPKATNKKSFSKYSNCFASISNPKQVLVLNFTEEAVSNGELIISKYEGTSDMINWISWSPYDPNHLAIANESGHGVIWDIEDNKNIATYYTPNYDSISTISWSPLGENLMISSSKDQTLRTWKISDYPPIPETVLKETRKKVLHEIQARSTDFHSKDNISEESEETNVKPKKSSSLLPNFYLIAKEKSKIISDLRKSLLWKENPSDEITEGSSGKPDILNIFGSNDNTKNFVKATEKVFQMRGQYHQRTQLSLFGGDISSSIRQAINEKRVNLFIISLAPMVSPKLWQEACETYADQLLNEADSDPLEIANYYLVCHKVEKAIDSLCQRSMFREALVLAKCRFMENDKTILQIMEKWAKDSLIKGNFELSAQCYIFLGRYEDAASVLFRRSDVEILKFATELAKKSGNAELHKAVMMRYNAFTRVKDLEADVSHELPESEQHRTEQRDIKADSLAENGNVLNNSDGNHTLIKNGKIDEYILTEDKFTDCICSTNVVPESNKAPDNSIEDGQINEVKELTEMY